MGAYLILELGGFGFFECFLEGRVFIKFQCNIGQFSGNFWRFWLILLLFFLLRMQGVSFMERAILGIIFIYI